jgi:hypothetical protein
MAEIAAKAVLDEALNAYRRQQLGRGLRRLGHHRRGRRRAGLAGGPPGLGDTARAGLAAGPPAEGRRADNLRSKA